MNLAYESTMFEYPGTYQIFNRVFNEAMSNHTTLIMKRILQIYKMFEGLKVYREKFGYDRRSSQSVFPISNLELRSLGFV